MKPKPQHIALALSCFSAGFLTCLFLMEPPEPKPAAAPAVPSTAMLTLPTVVTQEIRIDGGNWYQWPDGSMQKSVPPYMRPGYFDLIDARTQPTIELRDLR